MQKFFDRPRLLFALSFLIAAGVAFLSSLYMNFHVPNNDFWGVLYYGRHITWAERGSLYNGFFPIGYAFLVGQLFPYAYSVQLACLTNALLAGLLTASVSGTVAALRSLPATLFAIVTTITVPMLFQYANNPGPDIGVTAFSAFAIYLLWKDILRGDHSSLSISRSILIGLSLGMAVLWRSHAIVLVLAILLFTFLISNVGPLRARIIIVSSFLVMFLIQILANLISGHGALETAQNFNIYKLLYGVQWAYPPSPQDIAGFSVWKILKDDPRLLLNAYIPPLLGLVLYAWPGAACFLIAPTGPLRKYGLFSAMLIILYAIPLALGNSSRASLGIMGLFISSLAFLFIALKDRVLLRMNSTKWMPAALTAAFLLASAYPFSQWVLKDWEFLKANRGQNRVFASVEQVLLARGMTSSTQVYADRYRLYFPNTLPYQPYQIGGWSNGWMWGYDEEYPMLPNDSWDAFKQASKEQGIEYLVISPQAASQAGFFDAIYNEEIDVESLGLEFITRRSNMRIYLIK